VLFNFRAAGKRAPPGKRSLTSIIILYLAMLCGTAFLAFLPLICAMGAGYVASLAGCQLDEGNVHPCYILGEDRGQLLYELGVMGWFLLGTIPLGGILFLLATLTFIVQLVGYYRQTRAEANR